MTSPLTARRRTRLTRSLLRVRIVHRTHNPVARTSRRRGSHENIQGHLCEQGDLLI